MSIKKKLLKIIKKKAILFFKEIVNVNNESLMVEYRKIILEFLKNNSLSILSFVNRNKFSSTYGCFDREFWHYKSKNYFNGMNQCYILSLSLLYQTKFEGNYFFKNSNLKNLILGSINFSINNTHRDGSYDEHYYNEHSVVATSFALYCITESIILLKLSPEKYSNYLRKASNFLIQNEEFYVRSNHIACNILALYNVYILIKEERYKKASEYYLNKLHDNKSEEGWFKEYYGCDLGYLTFTLNFLTKYVLKIENNSLYNDIKKAIRFCMSFIHPDGSFGGFYGSRQTMHFLPYSFDKIEIENEDGKKIVNSFIQALDQGTAEIMSDSRFNFFLFNDLIEIYKNFSENRTKEIYKIINQSKLFEDAGFYVFKREPFHIILSVKNGGILYIFKEKKLIFRNCGIIAETNKGMITSSGFSDVDSNLTENCVKISSKFKKYKTPKNFTYLTDVFFKIFNITFGNFAYFRRSLKRFLIKRLILNERILDIDYDIEIKVLERIHLKLRIRKPEKINFKRLRISSYLPLKHIPSAAFFQKNDIICNDILLNEKTSQLNQTNKIEVDLTF